MKGLMFGFYFSVTFPAQGPVPEPFRDEIYNEPLTQLAPPVRSTSLGRWEHCTSGHSRYDGYSLEWAQNQKTNKKGVKTTDIILGCFHLNDPPSSTMTNPNDWLPHNLSYDFGIWMKNPR